MLSFRKPPSLKQLVAGVVSALVDLLADYEITGSFTLAIKRKPGVARVDLDGDGQPG